MQNTLSTSNAMCAAIEQPVVNCTRRLAEAPAKLHVVYNAERLDHFRIEPTNLGKDLLRQARGNFRGNFGGEELAINVG